MRYRCSDNASVAGRRGAVVRRQDQERPPSHPAAEEAEKHHSDEEEGIADAFSISESEELSVGHADSDAKGRRVTKNKPLVQDNALPDTKACGDAIADELAIPFAEGQKEERLALANTGTERDAKSLT